jgi:uncharacterized protein (DUF58 family)
MSPVSGIWFRLSGFFNRLRDWERRRFTRPGLGVLGALIVAIAMAPDTDNNSAYQAAALLLFLLLTGFLFSFAFRGRFGIQRVMPRFGTVGAPLPYHVTLRNLTAKPERGLALLEELVDQRPSYREWLALQKLQRKSMRSFRIGQGGRVNPFKVATVTDAAVPPAAPGEEVEVPLELTPHRRGVLQLKGLVVARADPLGLFRAFRRVPLPQSLLVLPKRYPLPPIALPGTMKYQEGGVALASNVGQSEEFVALRDYRQGDPLRHIHWRSWARTGKPVVKEFEDEFFVRHALVLDTFTEDPYSEVFEEAVSVAASFACTIPSQESLLDLLFVGTETYCFTAGRGLAHADQMLEILAGVRASLDHSFERLERLVLDHISVVSGVICVFLSWDPPRQELVRKLRALGVPLLVLVLAPGGQMDQIAPGPMSDQPDRFHVIDLSRVEAGLRNLR